MSARPIALKAQGYVAGPTDSAGRTEVDITRNCDGCIIRIRAGKRMYDGTITAVERLIHVGATGDITHITDAYGGRL